MPVTITKVGSGPSSNSASSIVATLTATIAVGERAVMAFGSFGGATSSVVDSKGNTWTEHVDTTINRSVHIWSSVLTTALVSGDTVTATLASAARHSTSSVFKVIGARTDVNPDGHGNTYASGYSNGTAWTSSTVNAPSSGGVAFCLMTQATSANSHTPNAGWTEIHETNTDQFVVVMTRSLSIGETGIVAGGASSSTNNGISALLLFEDAGPPIAKFSATIRSDRSELIVDFVDFSLNTPTSWSWDFGDGGSSSLQNPQRTYAASGEYVVTLTATNSLGSDDVSMSVFPGGGGGGSPITSGQFWPRG